MDKVGNTLCFFLFLLIFFYYSKNKSKGKKIGRLTFGDCCLMNRIQAAGEPPSPRAAHAAAAVGTMVVFQVIHCELGFDSFFFLFDLFT